MLAADGGEAAKWKQREEQEDIKVLSTEGKEEIKQQGAGG